MAVQTNAQVAERIYEKFNMSDFDRALDMATDDVEVVFVPTGQVFRGHDGFMQFMQGFKASFPDLVITLTNQIEADGTVINEFVAKGTNTGPLMTPQGMVPATGRVADWHVCEIWRIRDGKLAHIRTYQNLGTWLHQLGLPA